MILKREPKEKAGGDCPRTPCSPSDSDTPDTDAVTGSANVWNAFEEEIIALARKLERQRDELAEALQEMRYGHTDKAERMAVAALSFLENATVEGPAVAATPNPHQPT